MTPMSRGCWAPAPGSDPGVPGRRTDQLARPGGRSPSRHTPAGTSPSTRPIPVNTERHGTSRARSAGTRTCLSRTRVPPRAMAAPESKSRASGLPPTGRARDDPGCGWPPTRSCKPARRTRGRALAVLRWCLAGRPSRQSVSLCAPAGLWCSTATCATDRWSRVPVCPPAALALVAGCRRVASGRGSCETRPDHICLPGCWGYWWPGWCWWRNSSAGRAAGALMRPRTPRGARRPGSPPAIRSASSALRTASSAARS